MPQCVIALPNFNLGCTDGFDLRKCGCRRCENPVNSAAFTQRCTIDSDSACLYPQIILSKECDRLARIKVNSYRFLGTWANVVFFGRPSGKGEISVRKSDIDLSL